MKKNDIIPVFEFEYFILYASLKFYVSLIKFLIENIRHMNGKTR